jgi:hypothetical protein
MNSVQTAVLLVKKALENGLGRKNLNSASFTGGYLFYKLKQTNYAVNIENLAVFKTEFDSEQSATHLFVDEFSMMIQEYLKEQLNDEVRVCKLMDDIIHERGM